MTDDDQVFDDPEEAARRFDCDACDYRERASTLDTCNRLALRVHALLARRAVKELGLTPVVFEILGLRLATSEADALLDQVCLVHEHRVPVAAATPEESWLEGK